MTTTVSFRTDEEIKQDLETAAEKIGTSVSDILNELSIDFLDKFKKDDPELYSKLNVSNEIFKRQQIIEISQEIGKLEAREITYPQDNTDRLKNKIITHRTKPPEQKAKEIASVEETERIRLEMAVPIIEAKKKKRDKLIKELEEIKKEKLARALSKQMQNK
jgi:hypothetical protein